MAKQRNSTLMALLVMIGVLVIAGGWFMQQRNALVVLDEQVESGWAEINNQLLRRSDLIPNLVSTVQGVAAHEREVFTAIAEARSRLAGARTVSETAERYQEMESALSRLLVVAEAYPQLRANENFVRLQDELAGTENRIAVARGRYNELVRRYNTQIRTFPASMVASRAGMGAREYFEVSEQARQAPRVQFN